MAVQSRRLPPAAALGFLENPKCGFFVKSEAYEGFSENA